MVGLLLEVSSLTLAYYYYFWTAWPSVSPFWAPFGLTTAPWRMKQQQFRSNYFHLFPVPLLVH